MGQIGPRQAPVNDAAMSQRLPYAALRCHEAATAACRKTGVSMRLKRFLRRKRAGFAVALPAVLIVALGSAWAQSQSQAPRPRPRDTRPAETRAATPAEASRRRCRRCCPSARVATEAERRVAVPIRPRRRLGRRAHDLSQRPCPACAQPSRERARPAVRDTLSRLARSQHRSPGAGDGGSPRAPRRRPGRQTRGGRRDGPHPGSRAATVARSRRRWAKSRSASATTRNTPASRQPRKPMPATSWFPPKSRRSS